MPKVNTVCVVVPYFNGSKYIERALKSIYGQSRQADEILVINDGSSAEETLFLQRLREVYDFIIINKENGGQSSARNLGVQMSKSDYICLLDQDDYFLEWHIEHLIHVSESEGDDRFAYAYGDLWRGTEKGTVLTHGVVTKNSFHPKNDIYSHIKSDMHILPSASLISRQAFEAIGGYDESLIGYEDDDFFMRLFSAGYTCVFTERPVTFWTINKSSTSYSIKMSRSRWHFYCKLKENFPDDPEAGMYIYRDLILPRFIKRFGQDYLTSGFLRDENLGENKDRLKNFLSHVQSDTFARDRRMIILGIRSLLNIPMPIFIGMAALLTIKPISWLATKFGFGYFVPVFQQMHMLRRAEKIKQSQ